MDEEVAIPYSIDFSKFKYFIDKYNENEIQVVGFDEYYKTNINQKEAVIDIMEKDDNHLTFNVETNGYPCNINVFVENMNQVDKILDVEENKIVPFILNDGMSVAFEAENMHTYIFSFTTAEIKEKQFALDDKVFSFVLVFIAFCIVYLTLRKQ